MNCKNLFVLVIGLLFISNVYSQNPWHKNIEWEVLRLGYANTSDLADVKSGFAFGTEFRFNVSDRFDVGLSADASLFFSNIEDEGENVDFDYITQSLLTTDYYTSIDGVMKTFFGLSLGSLSTNTIFIRDGEEVDRLVERTGFVFGPRAGFEYKNWRVTLQKSISGEKSIPNNLSLSVGYVMWNKNETHATMIE